MRPISTSRTIVAVAAALGIAAAAAQPQDAERDETETNGDRQRIAAADDSGRSGFEREDPDLTQRRNELIREADQALRELQQENPEAAELMSQAYGHAVFATTKGGLFVTGAGGTGVARPHGERGGPTFMRLGSAGIGLGAGFESYHFVLLFRDQETYESFVSGEWDGALAAQAAAGTQGVSAEEQFLGGIRAFRVTDGGLMAQVDVSGVRFWPARNLNRAAEVEARVAEAARRGEPVGPGAVDETRVAEAEPPAPARDAAAEDEGFEVAAAETEETQTTEEAVRSEEEIARQAQPERLEELAAEREDLGLFIEAVRAAGLEDALTGETPYTVFAPTDEAFEAMAGMPRDELLAPENREELIRLLRAHIVADDLDRSMAGGIGEALTLDGETVDVGVEGERFTVGDADVVESDLQRGNLRIHVVDAVLTPRTPTRLAEAEDVDVDVEDEPAPAADDSVPGDEPRPVQDEEPAPVEEE